MSQKSPEIPTTTPETEVRRSAVQRLADALFGYDFFISYAHADGRAYAVGLARGLVAKGFDVFLDSEGYLPGDDWKRIGAWALKRTNRLVLVGTPKALESKPVQRELEIYTRAEKRVIPIDLDGCIGALAPSHAVARLLESSVIRLTEASSWREVGPREHVLNELVRTFQGERQQAKRSRWIRWTAAALLILVLALAWATKWALDERKTALREKEAAIRSTILSQSQALVAEARQVRDTRPLQSLLLASAAVENTRRRLAEKSVLPSAHQTLRDALANVGGHSLVGHTDSVSCVTTSPDGRWVVTGSADKTARLWDLTGADPAAQPIVLKDIDGRVNAVAVSPDSRWVVIGIENPYGNRREGRDIPTARLWNLTAAGPAAQAVVLKGHEFAVSSVAVSSDSRWIVTGSDDKTARLWDLKAADPAAQPVVLKGHDGGVRAVAVSPDSRWIVTGSDDNTTRLWDLTAADPAAHPIVLKGHDAPVSAVAVSSDSRWVVTGSYDKSARMWDLTATNPAAQPVVLKGHEDAVRAVAVSPDSRWVVTGSDDKTARLWNLKTADPPAQPSCSRGMRMRFAPSRSVRTAAGSSPAVPTKARGCGI